MYERSTDYGTSQETEEIHTAAKAPDSQGMGAEWQRYRGCQEYQIHPHTLYRWRKALEQGAEAFLSGKRRRVDPRIKELEEENRKLKEALAIQTQELMLLKKRMNSV